MTKRPNFLFFITDQHRADWLSCMGHPVVRTPNIDSIASAGVRFEGMHAASPVCMPNRASLMTGRYPSLHGLRHNGCSLSYGARTFADLLSDAGYHTAAFGKSHLQPFLDTPPLSQGDAPGKHAGEAWRDSGEDYAHEQPERYAEEGKYDLPLPYYGFQAFDMVTRHGDRCGGHYEQWFREQASDWKALHDPANQLPHNYTCPQAFRTPVPVELYPTTYIADRAAEYLSERDGDDRPFFAFVSFPDPHHPFNPPGEYWGMHSPEQFELALPYSAHRNPPPPLKWLKDHHDSGGGEGPTSATTLYAEDQPVREAMALTAGMVTLVDDAVGRVVDALKASGRFEETVIVFTSDHGDYLGDFNLLLKGALSFRSITRVPFIWSDPDSRRCAETDALASTVDVPATILDRAGVPPYNGMQGESFLPALNGAASHRDDLYMEYNDLGPRLGFSSPARVRSIVTRDWRYSFYRDQEWGELYDLSSDPNETCNLWDDPAHRGTRFEFAERLNNHLAHQMDESPRALRLA